MEFSLLTPEHTPGRMSTPWARPVTVISQPFSSDDTFADAWGELDEYMRATCPHKHDDIWRMYFDYVWATSKANRAQVTKEMNMMMGFSFRIFKEQALLDRSVEFTAMPWYRESTYRARVATAAFVHQLWWLLYNLDALDDAYKAPQHPRLAEFIINTVFEIAYDGKVIGYTTSPSS